MNFGEAIWDPVVLITRIGSPATVIVAAIVVRAALTPGGQVAAPTVWDMLYVYAWFVTFALGLSCI